MVQLAGILLCRRRSRGFLRTTRLRTRVAGRDGQAEHISAGARVARGHQGGQLQDFRSEHPLGGHHTVQGNEFAGVFGVCEAGE
ncbi:hypothetical protein GCM10023318_28100 [Nocardia callitridis]|uniref:Uncharacterized protein n=1 Tax=Nocardia callitridis TaxID=648753 RepID=A0ABP9K8Y0_9NOCA